MAAGERGKFIKVGFVTNESDKYCGRYVKGHV